MNLSRYNINSLFLIIIDIYELYLNYLCSTIVISLHEP